MSLGRVAVIGGTGDLGFGLALRLAKAGYRVVIGSRSGEKAVKASREAGNLLGGDAYIEGEENSKAAEKADVVILSIPFKGLESIIEAIKDKLSRDAIVVSCIVPLNESVGNFNSAAEYVSYLLKDRNQNIVAAYHTVSAEKLREITNSVNCDTIILGDEKSIKKRIAEITYSIEGLRPIDGGALKNAAIVERITPLLIAINRKYKIRDAGIRITGLADEEVRRRWLE